MVTEKQKQVRARFKEAIRLSKGKSKAERKLIFKRVFAGKRNNPPPAKPLNTSSSFKKTMPRKRFHKRGSRMGTDTKVLIGSAAYGLIGEPLLDMLASKVGLNTSDDIVKLGVSYLAYRQFKQPFVRGMALAGIATSGANVSKRLLGSLNLFGSNSTATTSSGTW